MLKKAGKKFEIELLESNRNDSIIVIFEYDWTTPNDLIMMLDYAKGETQRLVLMQNMIKSLNGS